MRVIEFLPFSALNNLVLLLVSKEDYRLLLTSVEVFKLRGFRECAKILS